MRKIIIFTTLFVLLFAFQVSSEEITLKNSFLGGWQYSTNGLNFQRVGNSGTELNQLMDGNPTAQKHMSKYKSGQNLAMLAGIPSGFLIGWTIGGYGRNGVWDDSYNTMLIIGIPLGIISMILDSYSTKHLKEAVQIYNGRELSLAFKLDYKPIIFSVNKDLRLSLTMNF